MNIFEKLKKILKNVETKQTIVGQAKKDPARLNSVKKQISIEIAELALAQMRELIKAKKVKRIN